MLRGDLIEPCDEGDFLDYFFWVDFERDACLLELDVWIIYEPAGFFWSISFRRLLAVCMVGGYLYVWESVTGVTYCLVCTA